MAGNDIGFAGVPTLAPWPGSASQADITNLQNQINAIKFATKLAADVANNTGAAQALGFNLAVTAGVPVSIQLYFFLTTSGAGGATVKMTHPGATSGFFTAKSNTINVSTYADQSVNVIPVSPAQLIFGFQTYAGNGVLKIGIVYVPSATGTVDFTIQPITVGQTVTAKAGSFVQIVS